tara:strand:- start:1219 stop:2058 length:840 start_codon:yes stop_codon:yes gene_type:complete
MIIWLASYPKSGNTWVRSFLSAYYYAPDGKFKFELLKNIKQFPSKDFFNKELKSIDEASENWLIAQRKIKENGKFCFLKTHNVNGAYKGKSFTNGDYTLGAIYIVRDPRNVLTSLMNHYSISEKQALKMISSIYRNLRDENSDEDYSSYSFISSWSNNYNSWKLSKNINTLFVKYEDLERETEKSFLRIIDFVNKNIQNNEGINEKKFRSAVDTTDFELLKRKEEKEGFEEAIFSKKEKKYKPFFNLGHKNNYKKLLNNETIRHIEKEFSKDMKELNYL